MVRLNAKTFKIDFEEMLVEGGGGVPWERMGGADARWGILLFGSELKTKQPQTFSHGSQIPNKLFIFS